MQVTFHKVHLNATSYALPGIDTPVDWFPGQNNNYEDVWIGVSGDGATNDVFAITTPIATILGAGWVRVYKGLRETAFDPELGATTYLDSRVEADRLASACCGLTIQTAAFTFKMSRELLDPAGPNAPCGALAAFKFLAVRGSSDGSPDVRNLTYAFSFTLAKIPNPPFDMTSLELASLVTTHQRVLNWPTDFVGLNNGAVTLVGPNVIAGGGEQSVSDFDNGTITVTVQIQDSDTLELVSSSSQVFKLPGTVCDGGSSSSSGE